MPARNTELYYVLGLRLQRTTTVLCIVVGSVDVHTSIRMFCNTHANTALQVHWIPTFACFTLHLRLFIFHFGSASSDFLYPNPTLGLCPMNVHRVPAKPHMNNFNQFCCLFCRDCDLGVQGEHQHNASSYQHTYAAKQPSTMCP